MKRIGFRLAVVTLTLVIITATEVFALRTGGEGNEPLDPELWPEGAGVIFNHKGRVCWWNWEDHWFSECRGDAKKLSAVLADYGRLKVKTKRVVVHDGYGRSEFLDRVESREDPEGNKIDWVFMITDGKGSFLRDLTRNGRKKDPAEDEPRSQLDVYTANINWRKVRVPAGIDVVDKRLESHGFTDADGIVLEGRVTDAATNLPVAATMRLQRGEFDPAEKKHVYPVVAESKADAEGRWVLKLKKAPEGWVRIVVEAKGYASRLAGQSKFEDQPQWNSYDTSLARPATLSGRITDESGKPLQDVNVRFIEVKSKNGDEYKSPFESGSKTDADGRFVADRLPEGTASIWLSKSGYCRTGGDVAISVPRNDVELTMSRASRVRVTVNFPGNRLPASYMVQIEPEEGEQVGKYGGSATIQDSDQYTFENVPSGRYVVFGHPNPTRDDQFSDRMTIELKDGEAADVKLMAK